MGLYDDRARYYDPALGRFVQADTIVPQPGNPHDGNRYAYVRNNPLRYHDPSGHTPETAGDLVAIVWDLMEVRRDPGDVWNWAALAVDVAAAIVSVVPGGVGMADFYMCLLHAQV